jgi:voltage-gated potassium channel
MRSVWEHVLIVRSVVGMLIILIAVNACAIAYFEHMKITDSLYFAFVTAFTIGYGDIAPVTAGGRIVSLLVGLLGLIFTGIIVAIATRSLARTFRDVGNEEKK